MVNTLQFNMTVPTVYAFMRRFLKAAQSDKKVCQTSLLHRTSVTKKYNNILNHYSYNFLFLFKSGGASVILLDRAMSSGV